MLEGKREIIGNRIQFIIAQPHRAQHLLRKGNRVVFLLREEIPLLLGVMRHEIIVEVDVMPYQTASVAKLEEVCHHLRNGRRTHQVGIVYSRQLNDVLWQFIRTSDKGGKLLDNFST